LLQKTLLNIEGLGRQLDPDLDLWKTAKPYLERWMSEQIGWRGLIENLKTEAPHYNKFLPQLPRLMHQALTRTSDKLVDEQAELMKRLLDEQKHTNFLISVALYLGVGLLAGVVLVRLINYLHGG